MRTRSVLFGVFFLVIALGFWAFWPIPKQGFDVKEKSPAKAVIRSTRASNIANRIADVQGLRAAINTSPESPDILFDYIAQLKSPLGPDAVKSICIFLAVPKVDGVSDTYLASVKNDLINRLAQEDNSAAIVQECLLEIQANHSLPPVLRDYALQHLAARFQTYPDKSATTKALLSCVEDDQETIAATAMIAIQRLGTSEMSTETFAHLEQAAIKYLESASSSEPAKMAALQMIQSQVRSVEYAKKLIRSDTRFPLRIAAVGVIGRNGTRADLESLQSIKDSVAPALQPALTNAISAIQLRN